MLQSVLFLTGHSFSFHWTNWLGKFHQKMMAALHLSGFGEWLPCCYSSLCPENMQATVIQQQEKRGTQNHWRTFCNSTSHSQCLGFGFSAHESALWRGMPCFNKNLTLYFPVGCSRYPLRDQEQGEAAFCVYSDSCSEDSQFHQCCRRSQGFLGFPPCAICIT